MLIKISLYHMLYDTLYIWDNLYNISDIFYMTSDLIYKISVCIINSKMAWARPGLCYRKAVQLAHSRPTTKLWLETRCLVHWRRNNCLTVTAHIYHCLKPGLWYQAILSPIVQSSVLQRHGLKTVSVSCYCQRVVQSSMHQRPGLNARILVSGYCQTVVQCSTHISTLKPGFLYKATVRQFYNQRSGFKSVFWCQATVRLVQSSVHKRQDSKSVFWCKSR